MKLIEALSVLRKRNAADPAFPIELICGFTAQPLSSFLAAHLQLRLPKRFVDVREGLFGDLIGDLDRRLRKPFGVAALVIEWSDLDSRLGWRQHGGWGRKHVSDICSVVERQVAAIADRLADPAVSGVISVALPTLPVPPVDPAPGWQYAPLRSRLDSIMASLAVKLASIPSVRMIDPDRITALSPPERRLDVKSLLYGGFPYQLTHADAIADLLAQSLEPRPPYKGIITDLDNTLWDGILGEVGVQGISWDLEHRSAQYGAYQQTLQALADSGILVAVASKNDPEIVRSAMLRRDLLLREESVFPVEAHWRPKSHSVSAILSAWNVPADSVIFVDDSDLDLAEVKNAFPSIHCRRFDRDPNRVAELVVELVDLCGKPRDSEEDTLRLSSLRASTQLLSKAADNTSLEQVLVSAEGVLTIMPVTCPPDGRALELVNKTNQFNLNGRRYHAAEWLELLNSPDRLVWMAAYEDRFGPLGRIAVVSGRYSTEEIEVDTWVLSCRAFGRRIEYAILDAVFRRTGARRIRFCYAPTDRNGPMRELLTQVLGSDPGECVVLDTDAFATRKLPWFMRVQ